MREVISRAARAGSVAAIAAILGVLCAGCGAGVAPLSAAESVREAWQGYRLGDFDRAAHLFESVVAMEPSSSDSHRQALYGAASVWNLRRPGEDSAKAEAFYRRLIELAPEHDLAAWSRLALARMQHLVPVGREPDYGAVRAAYQAVMDRHPGHLAAKEAFIYLQATRVATLDPEALHAAVRGIDAYVNRPGETSFLQPAYSLKAVCHQWLGEPDLRLQAEILSLEHTELDPANPYNEQAWAFWNIATIAEFECGDFDTARRYYRRLLEEYPTDIRVFATKQALERMDGIEARLRGGEAGRPP
jgi:tetratricopeptide (TPR) repeat protein